MERYRAKASVRVFDIIVVVALVVMGYYLSGNTKALYGLLNHKDGIILQHSKALQNHKDAITTIVNVINKSQEDDNGK